MKGKMEERREGKMWSVCKTKENVNKKRRKTKQTKSPECYYTSSPKLIHTEKLALECVSHCFSISRSFKSVPPGVLHTVSVWQFFIFCGVLVNLFWFSGQLGGGGSCWKVSFHA